MLYIQASICRQMYWIYMLASLFPQIFILCVKFKIMNLTGSFINEFTVFKPPPPSSSCVICTHTPYRMQLMLPVCSCAWDWWARTGKPIRGPFLVDSSSSFSSHWLCRALHWGVGLWGVFTHPLGPVSWSGFMQVAILLRVHRWGTLPCLEEAACRSHPVFWLSKHPWMFPEL